VADLEAVLLSQVPANPPVVVPGKADYLRTRRRQCREISEHGASHTRHRALVLEPEIEQVTDNKKVRRSPGEIVEKTSNLRLFFHLPGNVSPREVQIRYEVASSIHSATPCCYLSYNVGKDLTHLDPVSIILNYSLTLAKGRPGVNPDASL